MLGFLGVPLPGIEIGIAASAILLGLAVLSEGSRIDQSLHNPSGAVGVMQIKPSTAAGKPIYIQGTESNAAKNIHAGVKYLKVYYESILQKRSYEPFKQGVVRVCLLQRKACAGRKLRRVAAQEGLDPNQWFNNMEVVAGKEIGRETVAYVDDIYKYYVAYKLVAEREAMKKRKSHLHG